MKRVLLVVVILLCVGVGSILWLFQTSPPPRPLITFAGFRESSEGKVAVFRATNSSARPIAYWGKSPSEPHLWYMVPEGSSWITCRSMPETRHLSGTFTLKPHSSIEFVVDPPARKYLSSTYLGWGPDTPHPTKSKPPVSPDSFAVVVAFSPRDDTAFAKHQRPTGELIRTALLDAVSRGVRSGGVEVKAFRLVG